ncbi:hypothetical protein ACM01_15490 [Streptomyces viridochromogenes]|uniref:Uncharacterized protein n=1 Tax=Streptomyces viridochromogenes TaxID=1938 RepID=A0A0J7ZE63_STRVR|nr:hypothetical protein ACM01_15490 [Streptomyces viridochromogenes]
MHLRDGRVVPLASTVARAVYQNLPSLIAARSRYPEVKAPVHLVYGDFTQVPRTGHFIALERPDLLNAVA